VLYACLGNATGIDALFPLELNLAGEIRKCLAKMEIYHAFIIQTTRGNLGKMVI
jgi:hypothetical protein